MFLTKLTIDPRWKDWHFIDIVLSTAKNKSAQIIPRPSTQHCSAWFVWFACSGQPFRYIWPCGRILRDKQIFPRSWLLMKTEVQCCWASDRHAHSLPLILATSFALCVCACMRVCASMSRIFNDLFWLESPSSGLFRAGFGAGIKATNPQGLLHCTSLNSNAMSLTPLYPVPILHYFCISSNRWVARGWVGGWSP